MKKHLIAMFVLLSFFVNAQKGNKVVFEGGAVVNKPVQKPVSYKLSDGRDAGFAAYTSGGCYFKAGVDFKLLKRKAFSLELPVGISYKNVNTKTWNAGLPSGCLDSHIAYSYFNYTSKSNVQSVDFSFGIQPRYDVKKFSFGGNFMVSSFMNCKEQIRRYNENQEFGFTTKTSIRNLGTYVSFSSGLEGLYSVNNRFSFGPKCDIFFTKLGAGYHWISSDRMGPGRAVWVNPGIKMSYSLNSKSK
jgi:hypothetical protein